ncbi:type II toxin-antitoxin system YafQ family toxin [Periweissella fabalis]|uniref:Type II toxin-antitoxin system YafQ family toxin n=1 Tax=Periweissella fabalis TaxID=1070421 RepID=A0A7X6S1W0_9LACO|nr:type II toxin-antitoxin system YafQ family toxin [Periweissella fabalis]MCM0599140.1 type II toxin-antitoxin system YafQ family toxin [Periweissella fabalis]NKZ23419.1 type II toxin-antitoxin system YafQ family toxin [Periweissella fabalis]
MTDFKYKPSFESRFKKNYKKMIKGVRYKAIDFEIVYRKLLSDAPLDDHYNDHPLKNRRPERDLHIKPDWLLIYKYDGEYVKFIDTGTHSDLF